MIERKCETCERGGGCGLSDCRAPDWSHHFASRDALEAEVERLEGVAENLRCSAMADQADAERLGREVTRGLHLEERLAWTVRRVCAERDTAIARAAEERAARAGLEEQFAEAERRRDELRAESARARADVARLESELGGLRHSLAEVEDERDEAVSAMAEWRARAEVAEPERDEALAALKLAKVTHGGPWLSNGDDETDREADSRLRALLGDAGEGCAS